MQHLEAIILAGGAGSRFGGGKLLTRYGNGALIDGALRAAFSAPVSRTILVTGYDAENVGAAAKALAAREQIGQTLEVVDAERYREGMAETLKVGVAALSSDVEGAFVFLGDMPRVPWSLASTLAENIQGRSAAAPTFQGRRGHPVLFAACLFPTLLQLSGDRGARGMLDELADDLLLIDVDDAGVLFDVDQRSDLHP